ncbi:hypothetical protein [Neptunomonas qingdaonensis]|uniref:Uncharacterized protein n=1 Tax=Neptunomonas qingdaonensis TaxID=1045558 RepID=A0A1I2URX1_9GAMM|nr:hypothetical protein [Neptunomonas qingdaonensis]SFG79760.1 hypothetical protein SAMN05216175_1148 [Neptunomonas qingdaonensis]
MKTQTGALYRSCGLFLLISLPILMLVQGCTTSGHFQVSGTTPSAFRPSTAYNTKAKEFIVAYLREIPGKGAEVRVKTFDINGKGLGMELEPFGTSNHNALGRPALAYSPKSDLFILAVPAVTTSGTGHEVLIRFLDSKGAAVGKQLSLFSDQAWTYYDGDGVGSLHVTYNSLINEFLVTVQRTVQGVYQKENGIWAQRISKAIGESGKPIQLLNTTTHGIDSHTVAYAPVAPNTGGRYLFAYSGFAGVAEILDKNAKSIAGVTLNLGVPAGGNTHPDAAFGKIDGKERFLLVYSDKDNCKPGLKSCKALKDQWAGVWGAYIDPINPSTSNTPFPISKIWDHEALRKTYKPRVDYHPATKSFFVTWRELPTLDKQNEESRSHIRGNWISYLVKDGLANTTQVPTPPDNIVVSTATGSCQATGVRCVSKEDPDFPDTVATATGAAVVWHQKSPPNVKILSVVGRVIGTPKKP